MAGPAKDILKSRGAMVNFLESGRMSPGQARALRGRMGKKPMPKPKPPTERGPQFRTLPGKPKDQKPKRKMPKKPKAPGKQASFLLYNIRRDAIRAKG